MKRIRMLWILSAVWASLWLLKSSQLFQGHSWLIDLGPRSRDLLAALGAIAVGLVPLVMTWLVHKFHKSRERSRLLKEKARIETRLAKLDAQRDRASGGAKSAEAPA